jgi:hypothetical protein
MKTKIKDSDRAKNEKEMEDRTQCIKRKTATKTSKPKNSWQNSNGRVIPRRLTKDRYGAHIIRHSNDRHEEQSPKKDTRDE